jgi:hypothetical protein
LSIWRPSRWWKRSRLWRNEREAFWYADFEDMQPAALELSNATGALNFERE